MALDEQARHRLHMRLDEVLGPEVTGTLMELLPPVGWADVATRQDLDALGHRIDARIADLRADTMAEVGDLRTELRTGLAGVRTEMADLRADLTGEIASSQRLLLFGMLAAMFSLAGLVWGALTFAA